MLRSLLILTVIVSLTAVLATNCGSCNRQRCVRKSNCPTGIVYDQCGCCEICALTLDTPCKHTKVPKNSELGICGEGLECKIRDDLKGKTEATCQCKIQDELCGTDGFTYHSNCHIKEVIFNKGKNIKIFHSGPCEYAPMIRSGPTNSINKTGDYVALSCEVKGNPIPTITWTWKSAGEQKTAELPNDDLNISVNVRGGPEKYQKTGWLQITDIREEHEGDFTCHATNRRGQAEASARLKVTKKGNFQKRRNFRKRN